MGTALSNQSRCLFTLTVTKTWWVLEAGGICLAADSNTIWLLFPKDIILLADPLRIQVTKVVVKNVDYWSFQLVNPNFKCVEVMLEIKLCV